MNLRVSGLNLSVTESIRSHIEQRLNKVLQHVRLRLKQVQVRVGDVNGPRGGPDKRCVMSVAADGLPSIAVVQVDPDLYRAIDLASERLKRHLVRSQDRARNRRPASAV